MSASEAEKADYVAGAGPAELWRQSINECDTREAQRERYRELMIEHGHLIPRKPGDPPHALPCGWPGDRNA